MHERAMALNAERRVSQKDYEKLLAEANEDLERNKTAAKLRDLGAKHDVATAANKCLRAISRWMTRSWLGQ